MKKIFQLTFPLLFFTCCFGQENFTGVYGYSMPLENNTAAKEKSAVPGGRLVLIKMEGNQYRFWLDVLTGPPGFNRGETDGTITFRNDTASFDNTYEDAADPCILKFKKTGKTISINSQSTSFNCGFGNGVNADGEYSWLEKQESLNNDWLKKQYPNAHMSKIGSNGAALYSDQDGFSLLREGLFIPKGEEVLIIAETENTAYTEFITQNGNLKWGWIRKTDIKKDD